MLKYFCDICQNQIQNLEEIGTFQITKKVFIFLKHQKKDSIRRMEQIYCKPCAAEMLQKAEELSTCKQKSITKK